MIHLKLFNLIYYYMDFCNICANNVSNFELKNCPNCKKLACLHL